jgi:2-dehydro-3-deoxy-D-arabinonate dehydratase
MPIRVRPDSRWDVPEPELVLVINRHREIIGYSAGNDASSREIEGQNPLYLPQAKVYTGACALGPGIQLCSGDEIVDVPISMQIERNGDVLYSSETSTASLRRSLPELVEYLTRELDFPQGVFLMTGTCLVPGGDFTLQVGDLVTIQVGELVLVNPVGV